MKRLLLSALTAGISATICWAQSKTPQGALEEMATAEQPEAIARHLPDPYQRSIDDLPEADKKKVLQALLAAKNKQLEGGRLRHATDTDGWELLDPNGQTRAKVKLTNVFFSGIEALVLLEIDVDDSQQSMIVGMHVEGRDWCIDNFGSWAKEDLGLKKLVHVTTEAEKNEIAARETLETISSALSRFVGMAPEGGYPSSLRALTVPVRSKLSEISEPLLGARFGEDILVIRGYQFRYSLTASGGGIVRSIGPINAFDLGQFQLTATPVDFGKTGTKSFFVDQGGQIRATSENRPANEHDEIDSED